MLLQLDLTADLGNCKQILVSAISCIHTYKLTIAREAAARQEIILNTAFTVEAIAGASGGPEASLEQNSDVATLEGYTTNQ